MSDVHLVWSDRDWRCELHSADGHGRLKIFRGPKLVVLEPTPVGEGALARAEALRQILLSSREMH